MPRNTNTPLPVFFSICVPSTLALVIRVLEREKLKFISELNVGEICIVSCVYITVLFVLFTDLDMILLLFIFLPNTIDKYSGRNPDRIAGISPI